MKKALKILGITLLIILCLLIAIPFAFKTQIKDMVKRSLNQNLNAKVEFTDVNLSLLKSFPQAHVVLDNLIITNFKPFENETFVTAKSIAFTMSVKELFKKADEEPMVVNSIIIDEALLTLKTDKFGNNNYDIGNENKKATAQQNNFSFNIEDYKIDNSALTFIDEKSKTHVYITELNHSGRGIFSTENSKLDTKTQANVSFIKDSIAYLSSNQIKLDALIDLNNNKYTFKENKGFINQLPLKFNGYVQQLENGQDVDITFENPESSFKDFLAIIPKTYSKDLDNVETTGNFKVNGEIKGLISDETIPTLDIKIISNNASFKYPELPKRVENITINTSIKNETGNADDTYLDIETFNFKIDNDIFKSSATLKKITKNVLVNAHIDGKLNLDNITKVYPIKLDTPLSGVLIAKLNTAFDMNAIETNAYERIKNDGSASLSNFLYTSKDFSNPIQITKANITFNSNSVSLNTFEAKTGQSDLIANGTIKNFIGFLLNKNDLQGNFNLNANNFVLNDFLSAKNENTSTSKKEAFKIPAFLDCTINANAKTVIYDNLNLKDLKGTLYIKDQQATLKGLTSNLFDGILAVTGDVSTKSDIPTFDLNLGADNFDISKSFKELELLQNLAPIAKILQGKLNSTINLSGQLDNEFSPILTSLSGKAFAQVLATSIKSEEVEILNKLGNSLKFIDFNKLDLKNFKTQLEFENGNVTVKPFDITYNDINIAIGGSHGFDKTVNYNAKFNVPAKYLGSDVNRLIGKINDNEVNNLSIPVSANIGGTFSRPNVTTDLTAAVSNLTKQLIEIEKQKLLNTGKDKINEILGGISGETKNDTKTTNNDSKVVKTDSMNVNTPTIKSENPVEEDIKNILGGLIKKRKTKNDTIK